MVGWLVVVVVVVVVLSCFVLLLLFYTISKTAVGRFNLNGFISTPNFIPFIIKNARK